MIRAEFLRAGGVLTGATVTGHAGYAERGEDIVCASVTSAVQLVCNGITEVLKVDATVQVEDNLVRITLPQPTDRQAAAFLKALQLHFDLLGQDYPQYLTTTISEV